MCQLAINVIDNAFSTGFDTAGKCRVQWRRAGQAYSDAGLFPNFINIRRGAYLGLILSIALCPWELLSSAATFISVLSAYSVFLGPMVGIQLAEYWILRKRRVKLSDLYHNRREGIYYYFYGINWRSFVSWVVGWASQIPGFAHAVNENIVVPAGCTELYYLAYPLGFAISFIVHLGLNKLFPPVGLGDFDAVDYYGTFSPEEAAHFGVEPYDGRMEGQTFDDGRQVYQDGVRDYDPKTGGLSTKESY